MHVITYTCCLDKREFLRGEDGGERMELVKEAVLKMQEPFSCRGGIPQITLWKEMWAWDKNCSTMSRCKECHISIFL